MRESATHLVTNPPLKVWVLAPHLITEDQNLDYYYDFTQSIREYEKAFAALGIEWVWQPVNLNNYTDVIEKIAIARDEKAP